MTDFYNKIMKCTWHPIYSGSLAEYPEAIHWDMLEFEEILSKVVKFMDEVSKKSINCPTQIGDTFVRWQEISLYNDYHPLKHYYYEAYNVDPRDYDSWKLSNDDIKIMKKYGWKLKIKK